MCILYFLGPGAVDNTPSSSGRGKYILNIFISFCTHIYNKCLGLGIHRVRTNETANSNELNVPSALRSTPKTTATSNNGKFKNLTLINTGTYK